MMVEPIELHPIGYVRTDASPEAVRSSHEKLVSDIEVLEAFEAALEGIDGFSHVIALFWMHGLDEAARATLRVKPRGLLRHGLTEDELPTIGVFACDAPVRPNPIGLSVVEVLGRDGRRLHVRGLDAFDGSPVLDIKPYTADRSVTGTRAPGWHDELLRRSGASHV
jgi:tRNA-Thr(GGU) m(6)t(6)A37 methyltransferase TsaA